VLPKTGPLSLNREEARLKAKPNQAMRGYGMAMVLLLEIPMQHCEIPPKHKGFDKKQGGRRGDTSENSDRKFNRHTRIMIAITLYANIY